MAKKKAKKKTSKKKVKTKSKVKRVDRLSAAVTAIQGIATSQAVHTTIQNSDEIYAKAGGSKNPAEAKWSFNQASRVMVLLGLISIEDGTITKIKG